MITSFRRSVAVLVASVCFLGMTPARGSQGFAVGSLDLGLTGQSGWFEWFNAFDSPETAYLGTIYENQPTVTGNVQLRRTIQPGRYYVAWKVLDYGAGGNLDFSIGGSPQVTTPLNSGDFNGQWSVPVPIDVPVASTNVQVSFRRTVPLASRQILLLRGIYVSTSQGEVVFGDDSIVIPQPPTQEDPTIAHKGNILQNGSFEVGTGHGWGMGEAVSRTFSVSSMWDNTVAFEGAASLKVPNGAELVSRPYRVRGNRKYTFSAWIKTAREGNVTLTIQNAGISLPTNYPAATFLFQTFPTTTNWQRVSLSGILWDYPSSDYLLRVEVNDQQGEFTWVDGVQFEEGNASGFVPGQTLEAGLICSQPGNLFYEDEPTTMQLWVRNSGNAATSATVPYEVYDYMNKRVAAGSTNVTIPAQGRWSGDINISPGLRGIFRAVLSIQGVDHSREEVVYGVVPRPQQMGIDTNSLIGIHANFTAFQAAALQKLGIKWNRASSPSRAFRWTAVQPTGPTFHWSADDMTIATSHGISVLGTLGLEWPAWAATNGLPDLAKWETFVAGVVEHYKDQVKYWEVWNEGQYSFTPTFYAQLLQRAVTAIRSADPQAQIVGLGGSADLNWSTNVLKQLGAGWTTNLAAVSTHLYPKIGVHAYNDFRNQVRDHYNVAVWNTEVGVWDRGFYMSENSDFIQTDYIWPQKAADRYFYGHRGAAELLAYAFMNNVGNGLSKFFYYDGRVFVGPGYPSTHSSIVEYDDSIRAKGLAYSVLARLFDHSAGLGDISSSPNCSMFLFDRGGTPLVGLWSLDQASRSLTLGLSSSSYRVYDLMGNLISISNGIIRFGGKPVYIEGQGISVTTLRSAVLAGTIALAADTTPPNLALVTFPTGPTRDNPVKLRWLAIDETSIPSDGAPKAIEYSYLMQGYDAGWSPWVSATFVDYLNVPPGTYQFTVKSRDAAGNVSSTSQVEIVIAAPPTSSAPILDSIVTQTVDELALMSIPVTATDADEPGQSLAYSILAAPSGVTINPLTGLLMWSPNENQGPGTHDIKVRVVDNGIPSLSATQSFSVVVNEVNSAPVLSAIGDQSVDELELLSVVTFANDFDAPSQALTYSLVSAPLGVEIDPDIGLLTWLPTENQGRGTYAIKVRVSDDGSPGLSATQTFAVVVNEVNSAPTLAPISNQTIDELVPFFLPLSATDVDYPAQGLTYTLLTAPSGVTLHPTTGLLTWNPSETTGPSTRLFKVRVADNGTPSLSATQRFNITIREVNSAPVLAPINSQTVNELVLLTVTLSANDFDLPVQTISYGVVSAPNGVTLNAGTGILTWTPSATQGPATNVVTVRAFDSGSPSMSSTQSFTVVVNDVTAGEPLRFIPSSVEVSGGIFRVQITGGATQGTIVIEASNNLLQWIPVYTNAASGDTFQFSDATPRRFYRAKEQP